MGENSRCEPRSPVQFNQPTRKYSGRHSKSLLACGEQSVWRLLSAALVTRNLPIAVSLNWELDSAKNGKDTRPWNLHKGVLQDFPLEVAHGLRAVHRTIDIPSPDIDLLGDLINLLTAENLFR
jgi:hypothetical protein